MSENPCVISGGDFFKINITNSQNNHVAFDIKFSKSLTVADLKEKLQLITGGNAGTMQIELHKGDTCVLILNNDSMLLGSLNITPGMHFHVKDNSIIDINQGEKFDLSDDQYERMDNTLRDFLRKNRLGKYNEEEAKLEEQRKLERERIEKEKSELCKVGKRCQVFIKGQPVRRGTIMYNGTLDGKNGVFIGVKYDEPLGKNDGSVNGKRYFICPQNYGSFVAPTCVEVGDFPEIDYNLDDEL